MTVTINGSSGISSPGGDTSTSLSTGLLTVTGSTVPANGMYLPGTNTLAWATNSTERMRLDSSGNLGVGTSSPGFKLSVAGYSNVNSANKLAIGDVADYQARLYMESASETFTIENTSDYASSAILFRINGSERARIDSSGNFLVGTTSGLASSRVYVESSSNTGYFRSTGSGTAVIARVDALSGGTTGTLVYFQYGSAEVGKITTNGSNTTYATSSDQRLKKNIIDASGALSSVNAIKVRSFDWKSDGSHVDYGYIAQELLEVVPEAVSVPTDSEEMMGVDFGRLTPRLVKAIQELTARLEALEGAK